MALPRVRPRLDLKVPGLRHPDDLAYGGTLHPVPYRSDGYNDLVALSALARSVNATIVYLANPDNPTGTWYSPLEVAAFVNSLPSGSLLVLDEAYCEFAPEGARAPIDADDPPRHPDAHLLEGSRDGGRTHRPTSRAQRGPPCSPEGSSYGCPWSPPSTVASE